MAPGVLWGFMLSQISAVKDSQFWMKAFIQIVKTLCPTVPHRPSWVFNADSPPIYIIWIWNVPLYVFNMCWPAAEAKPSPKWGAQKKLRLTYLPSKGHHSQVLFPKSGCNCPSWGVFLKASLCLFAWVRQVCSVFVRVSGCSGPENLIFCPNNFFFFK